jgi:hypothetical protein
MGALTELTPVERSAMVGYLLASGQTLDSKRVAELTDCKPDTARRLLNKLCRVLPLAEDAGDFVIVSSR